MFFLLLAALLLTTSLFTGVDDAFSAQPAPHLDAAGRTLTVTWSSSEVQRAAWLAAPSEGLRRVLPEVSLKVALPPGEPSLAIRLAAPVWVPTEIQWPLKPVEDSALGSRGVWRGVPYQEILLRPVRPAAGADGTVEVLASAVVVVEIQTAGVRFSEPDGVVAQGGDSGLFLNPADVRPVPPKEQVGRAPFAPEAGPAPGLRVTVTTDGLVRADYAWLTVRGFDPTGKDPRNFRLTCQGVDIPLLVEGEGDGVFGAGDAIVFYGQKAALPARAMWNGGDFTDANVYWLRAEASPVTHMMTVNAAPVSGYPSVTSFLATVRAEEDTYLNVTDHIRPNGSVWYWGPTFGTAAGGIPSARSITLNAPGATGTGADPATVELVTSGLGAVAHSVSPRLNGNAPSLGSDPWSWSGFSIADATWTFDPSAVIAGGNTLALTVPGYPDHADYQAPDYVLFTYRRSLASDGGTLLLTPPNEAATYASSGYSVAPYILDLSRSDAATGLVLPRRLTGATFSGGMATFQMPYDAGVSGRRVVVTDTPLLPSGAAAAAPPDLTGPDAGAELLVVTYTDFAPASPTSAWQRWLTRRGASHTVRTVMIQDLFDNFSHGLFDPPAIRNFLEVVGATWTTKPRWVLLVGDGTWDYENRYLKAGFLSTVPTMAVEDLYDSTYLGRYVSDSWFADWNGDGYSDAAVGRLPVHSAVESEGVFAKLLAYEDQTLSGTWYKTSTFVADVTDSHGQNFEAYLDLLSSRWSGAPWTPQKLYYGQSPYGGANPVLMASDLRTAFPASSLLMYSGHGYFVSWGYNLGASAFFSSNKVRNVGETLYSDVDLLSPSWHLPFVLQGTCYSSSFAEANFSALAEELLDRPDRGSIGSVGQTGIGYASEEQAFTDAFFGQAFGVAKVRDSGDLVEAGRFALPSTNPRAVFGNVLLGDPTLALRLPAPPPPAALSATGQDASVALLWTEAAPAPAGYRLYRTQDAGATWSLLPSSPLPGGQTSFTDTGLTNAVGYGYYLTSLDAEGFEGAPSPVASATPLNPSPPSVPVGLTATDAGTGDAVDVRWAANAEADLAGYTLWWGVASGVYTTSQELPKSATEVRLTGLAPGVIYYFTLTASNTSGRTSGYAPEVHASPTSSPLAVRPPARITDLRVTRSGNDLVLTWTKPLLDVGGQAVTVAFFQVFRVVGGYDWSLDAVSPLAPSLPATTATTYTYTDPNAVSSPGTVTYLVVAFNTDGDRSPASTAPPAPVLGLRVSRSASSGKTLLTFPPVTSVADGSAPCQVDHYTVYGFAPPMAGSSDHVRPAAPTATATVGAGLPADPLCEGALVCDALPPDLYYTVVAVDRRGNTSLY